jgi:hypothetical protein
MSDYTLSLVYGLFNVLLRAGSYINISEKSEPDLVTVVKK